MQTVVLLSLVKQKGVERQVWYSGCEFPQMLLLGCTQDKHSKARPTHTKYYITRVIRQ